MTNVINLRKARQKRAEGKTLCSSGFHKWQVSGERRFDVKEGKLLSLERCLRCKLERTRLT